LSLKNVPRTLTLVVPETPNPQLLPNRRLHWAAKGRAVKEERELWYALMRECIHNEQEGLPLQKVKISFELTYPDRRHRDTDNLLAALKPCIDTMCAPKHRADTSYRLGIIQDDSPDCMVAAPSLITRHEPGVRETKIVIEEVE
jgi:Holliday junction resolvase RusA-like endonuclease